MFEVRHTEARRQSSFVFEVTQRCNHDCPHCYNAWKNPVDYPSGELDTTETLAILAKMLRETGAGLVSLSGGEPLLRRDIQQIVDFLVEHDVAINLITNGSLLDAAMIERFPDKISLFELPLLSCERMIHDRLSGAEGAFDRMTMALADLKAGGQRVVGVFVATKMNLPTLAETAELGIALGLDGIMFNRFNPGGRGFYYNIERLQVSPAEIQAALDMAERISETYDFPISCSIAMPPCLIDTTRYQRLTFGFCAAGTERAYYTLDPLGNLRPCNHSPLILGNIREQGFWEMADGDCMSEFCSARPDFCSGCRFEWQCQGGCKAAAEACYGSAREMDPFLSSYHRAAVPP